MGIKSLSWIVVSICKTLVVMVLSAIKVIVGSAKNEDKKKWKNF